MKKIKITRWGFGKSFNDMANAKVHCIKAVKDLMSLSLCDAKNIVDGELPFILRVCDDKKLKAFTDYTQVNCPGIQYSVTDWDEDSDHDVDVAEYKNMSRTDIVNSFNAAINNIRAAFDVLINQNDEVGNRYNKVCTEASILQAEVEKLKANNNNDLCIQLREEIACLTRDNGKLKETNNCLAETIEENEKTIDRLEKENSNLREGKKVVEAKNDDLVAVNKSLEETIQIQYENLRAIKDLAS